MPTTMRWFAELGLPDLAFAGFLLVVALAEAQAAVRRRPERWWQVLVVVFAVYVVAALALVYCPLPSVSPPSGLPGRPPPSPAYSLGLHLPGHGSGGAGHDLVSVLLAVPLGLMLRPLTRWRTPALVATVVLLPVLVETSQLTISLGVGYDWRDFALQDVVTRSLGGLAGLALFALAVRVLRPRRHRAAESAYADSV